MVERLFLAVPRGCLQFVIVVIPDHTLLLFLLFTYWQVLYLDLLLSKRKFCKLVPVAEETGLSLIFSETRKIGFVAPRLI